MAPGAIEQADRLIQRKHLRRLLGVFCIFGAAIAPLHAQTGWYDGGWTSRQKITIDSDAAGYGLSGDLTDFPFLIKITSAANDIFGVAQSDGDDILFTSSNGTTKLSHEIENYDDGGGTEDLTSWVELPTFVYNADTVIYMYYGNATAENQEDVQNVWDNDFAAVYHLGENGSSENYKDSSPALNVAVGGTV